MKHNIEPRLLKGFRDTMPEQMAVRQHMIRTIESVLQSFGFGPLETPTLEYADILLGKLGDEGEKLLYQFKDHGNRDVAMRYDLTVPLARVVAQYPELPKPFKRYQVGPVWRADNTQRGRYREFYQFDMDIVGSDSNVADAEILVAMQQCLLALGVNDFVIRINDRRFLNRFAQDLNMSDRQNSEFYTILDKAEKVDWETTVNQLAAIGLDDAAVNRIQVELFAQPQQASPFPPELEDIIRKAKTLGLMDRHFTFDPTIVRGLDYYTGIVFETTLTKAPEFGSVFSGGRYDGLVELFSNNTTPAVGASIGVDRLLAALSELGVMPKGREATKVYVTVFSPELLNNSLAMGAQLRSAGISAEISYQDHNLGKQLKKAVERQADFAIIIGPDEAANHQVTLRNLNTHQEAKLSADQVPQTIKRNS